LTFDFIIYLILTYQYSEFSIEMRNTKHIYIQYQARVHVLTFGGGTIDF